MESRKYDRRLPHRGTADDQAKFATDFLKGRLAGFEKDMRICLTGIPSEVRSGLTHAYFPALGTCCGGCWNISLACTAVGSTDWGNER